MMPVRAELFPPPEPRDFEEDLKNSESPEVYALTMASIQHWYPGQKAWFREHEAAAQRKGRDIVLEGGTVLQIKARWTDFDDFLIEYKHVFHDGRVKPGWIEEYSEENIDAILYAQIPLRKVSRVDIATLKKAWAIHGDEWKNGNSTPNPSYDTHWCTKTWEELEAVGVAIDHLEIPAPNAPN